MIVRGWTYAMVLSLAVLPACRAATDTPAPVEAPAQRVASVGDTIRIATGDSVRIGPDGPVIRFDRVMADSRCPAGVTCVWAGSVRVRLLVSNAGESPSVLELESNSTPKLADVGQYRIALLPEVEPAHGGAGPYTIRLTVTRVPS